MFTKTNLAMASSAAAGMLWGAYIITGETSFWWVLSGLCSFALLIPPIAGAIDRSRKEK